jgi:hypothetical protein
MEPMRAGRPTTKALLSTLGALREVACEISGGLPVLMANSRLILTFVAVPDYGCGWNRLVSRSSNFCGKAMRLEVIGSLI